MRLQITDKIRIVIETESQKLINAIDRHHQHIMKQTLALSLDIIINGKIIKYYEV